MHLGGHRPRVPLYNIDYFSEWILKCLLFLQLIKYVKIVM